jgi:phenylacetic acid degradation operon negative regulatory protein
MIVTLFGDVVSQHGGWIWMGSIIETLAPLGFHERLVRTSVYRLVQSDWLEVKKFGRKSYYCFSETAHSHYERVARRIYISEPIDWDGKWLLVMPVSVPEDKREALKKSLLWQGFNTLANGLYAHPSSERRSLDETLLELKLAKDVAVFSAAMDDLYSLSVIKDLVHRKWDIEALQDYYQEFLGFYRSLNSKVDVTSLSPAESFMYRSTLIHDYRRIQLRDQDLPRELLPNGWVGYEAQDLVKKLYTQLAKPSIAYIEAQLFNAQGLLSPPTSKFYSRFG